MFTKEIDRDIRGVIKADQTGEEDVYQELEEYVVTREMNNHLSKFYENYLRAIDGKTDKVGVWISGFFGSGKSHFLKILSYLLKNKYVKDKEPIDFFSDKILDPVIYANMKRTADVPTETILFNIDSKSPLGNKEKEDAILRVLLKVFNEHRGYYGDNPAIAEFEKYLDDNGFLEAYKIEFAKVANESWENRRHSFYFDFNYVKTALLNATDMTEEAIEHWLQHGVDHVEISIEKFAKEVKEYIDSKGSEFRLIFLIDEIGQYIGDRRDLMLNLQTVTENLGALCEGRAWVMVTSQESIDSIVRVKGDDFSRIQGRFDTRLSLSSISVDEVIQKRILEKKEYVTETLKAIYVDKGAILRNVITFVDSTGDFSGYRDEKEFADVYPFIPYQFNLLQNVFEQLRKHGSSGKHLSEGERSMLSAYREAGMQYMEKEQGTLIPFYAFYDTVSEFLQPTVSRVIERAAENPKLKDDPFNIQLLKVLFLIKYVEELPANIDNIATLMVTHIDEDKLELKEKIKQSLRKLINERLIQKNGDLYIFLTDDEQDINNEIKSLSIDENELKRDLATYVFDDIYDAKRYRYNKWYDFPFNQKMDERNYGNQTFSIGINILSPLSERYHQSEQELMMYTSGGSDVVVRLADGAYVEDIEEAIRIEKYRRGRNINELPENIQNILNNKQAEQRERRRRARELMKDAIKNATFYMNGIQVDIKGASAKDKINEAFKMLVENVYSELSHINQFVQDANEIRAYLRATQEQLSSDDTIIENLNTLAREAVEAFITLQNEVNEQVRVKTLYDRFTNSPYGWRELDIARIIAELLIDQKIRIRYNATYLEPREDTDELMTVFTTKEADRGIVILRQQVDEQLIRSVRSIARDLFNKRDLATDEDGLIRYLQSLMEEKMVEINNYKARYEGRKYPGMGIINKGLELFGQFDKSLDHLTYFTRFKDLEDDLFDWDDIYDNIISFFTTDLQNIFDNGLQTVKHYEEIKNYVQTENVEAAMEELNDILNDPVPYQRIKDIPELINVLDEQIKEVLQVKRTEATEKIQLDFEEASLHANQYGVSEKTKQRIKIG